MKHQDRSTTNSSHPGTLKKNILQDPTGHLFMKQLLQREAEAQLAESAAAGKGGGPWFADALLEQATGELSAWAGKNRGGFVVAALEKVPSAAAEVRRVMGEKGARAQLVKDAKAGTSMGVKVRMVLSLVWFRCVVRYGGWLVGWLMVCFLMVG